MSVIGETSCGIAWFGGLPVGGVTLVAAESSEATNRPPIDSCRD
jgi:hypothetical protein